MSGEKEHLKSYDSPDPLVKYAVDHSLRLTEAQKELNELTLQHPRRGMLGAPEVLQLNQNLIRSLNARKVLDIGVFTGASSLAAAIAMPPDGEVHALDISDDYVDIGRPFWLKEKVSRKIRVYIDPALQTLDMFIAAGHSDTFDFAFIDADKTNYEHYVDRCHTLLKTGGIISIDNTLWSGKVLDESDQSPDTVALRKLNIKLKDDDRFHISFLKVGDGLTLLFKK